MNPQDYTHEMMRRYVWAQVYLESIKQTRSFYGASTDADRALKEFDEKFKPITKSE